MEIVIALALIALIGAIAARPLLRPAAEEADADRASLRADLEARKEAKYREIRDAEADHAAGKLSDEDFKELDRELRAEAVAILKELDDL